MQYSEDGDYLGIGLKNDRLQLVWSLGWMSRNEILTEPVNHKENVWNSVDVLINGQNLTLSIDGKLYHSYVNGHFHELNTHGLYYFGGLDDSTEVIEFTGGFFTSFFIGCIGNISISGHKLNIGLESHGQNVELCSDINI